MKSVMHEIRNHLAVAVANIEAFRDGVLDPSKPRLVAVLQALMEVDVLLDAVPNVADAAPFTNEPRMIDVCAVITNEVLAFEAAARERGIAFAVKQCDHSNKECSSFNGDPMRIAEIVNNVISNAIRYTPAGGRIDVDCRKADGSLMLSIADDGPGVRTDESRHIFDAGFRGSAAEANSGSGVGLALTKRFVEDLGGTIAVDNVNGKGARFTVQLPGGEVESRYDAQPDGSISLL